MKKTLVIILACCGFLAASTNETLAQKVFTLGTTLEASGGADNNPRIGFGGSNLGLGWTTTFTPRGSLFLNITGQRTSGRVFYTYSNQRFINQSDLNYHTHNAGFTIESQLSRRFNLVLTNDFIRSPDFTSAQVLGDIRITPEGLFFDFENVLLRRQGFGNTATVNTDYELSPLSNLEVDFSHRMRKFDENPDFSRVSNQRSFRGNIAYRRRFEDRSFWDVRYSFIHNDFDNFENALTHNVTLGLNHDFSPEWSIRLGTGPSFSSQAGTDIRADSFNAEARLNYTRGENQLSVGFRRQPSTATGIGSVSNVNRATISFTRILYRETVLRISGSAYDSQPVFDNPVDLKGYGASASYTIPFSQTGWFVIIGGSYNDQSGTRTFAYDRGQVYVSIRWTLQELFSF